VAWRLHVLTVRRRFALLLGERARLSREVHDTLLQSMFGFALQVDALGAAVANSAPELRSRLASLRHQVEEDIREARQSIWNLRSPKLEAQDLPSALKDAAEHAAASNGVRPVFAVSGAPRRAPPGVEEQLLRIGREAIANVVRHAHAHEMQVALQYDEDRITLRVRDDGQGFEPSAQSVMAEHFGLTTMRERAESVGGTLVVDAHPGTGTTVTVVIPDAHS
jgi:signal transduction histidine kinase